MFWPKFIFFQDVSSLTTLARARFHAFHIGQAILCSNTLTAGGVGGYRQLVNSCNAAQLINGPAVLRNVGSNKIVVSQNKEKP